MGALKDLTGKRFGRLVVLARGGSNKHKKALWACSCDCGGRITTLGASLLVGRATSCGCYRSEMVISKNTVHGFSPRDNRSSEYKTWLNMHSRCRDENRPDFKYYGGRGLRVCERWNSFSAFMQDMGPKPPGKPTIERIDNDGIYEPGNCRWASMAEQNLNKRPRGSC